MAGQSNGLEERVERVENQYQSLVSSVQQVLDSKLGVVQNLVVSQEAMRLDIVRLTESNQEIRNDIRSIKTDIRGMKTDIANLDQKFDRIIDLLTNRGNN